MVLTSSVTMQSLGKIVLHVPAVGAKMWCLFVFLSCSVHHAFEGVYFEQVLHQSLYVDFHSVFTFSEGTDCPFRCASFYFCR